MSWRVSGRANFWFHVSEGAFATFAFEIMSVGAVLPILVSALGGGPMAIGFTGALHGTTAFLQLVAARFVEPLPRKKLYVVLTGIGMRVPYVVMPVVLLVLARAHPQLVLAVLFTTLAVGAACSAFLMPAWMELVRTTIPAGRRGRLFGLRYFFSNLMVLPAGALTAWLLAAYTFPGNYAAVVGLSGVATALSWLLFLFVNDAPAPTSREALPWGEYWRELYQSFRKRPVLRSYLLFVISMAGSLGALAFLPMAVTKGVGLSEATVGTYVAVAAAVRMLGAPVAGFLADRLGPRRLLPVSASLVVGGLCAAAAARGFAGGVAAYGLMSAGIVLNMVCHSPVVMELAHGRARVAVLVLPRLVASPVQMAAPLVAGLMVRSLGYGWLFRVAAVVALLAVWAAFAVARRPSTGSGRGELVEPRERRSLDGGQTG